MSVTREVKLTAMDIDLLEEVAREMGCTTQRNVHTKLYYNQSKKIADIVVSVPGRNQNIGFVKGEDGKHTVEFDDMMNRDYGKLIGKYFERLAERRTRNAAYQIRSKERVNGKLRIVFRRAR